MLALGLHHDLFGSANLHPICIQFASHKSHLCSLHFGFGLKGLPVTGCHDVMLSWPSFAKLPGPTWWDLLWTSSPTPFPSFLAFRIELSPQVAHSMKVVSLIKRQKPILSRHSRKIFIRHFKSCDKSAFPSTCTKLGVINVMCVSYAEFSGSFFILCMPSFAKRWVANH